MFSELTFTLLKAGEQYRRQAWDELEAAHHAIRDGFEDIGQYHIARHRALVTEAMRANDMARTQEDCSELVRDHSAPEVVIAKDANTNVIRLDIRRPA